MQFEERETEEQRPVRVLAWRSVRGRSRNARKQSPRREEGEQNVVTDWMWETSDGWETQKIPEGSDLGQDFKFHFRHAEFHVICG